MSDFVPLDNPSSFRRIAASVWHRPNDPSIYGNAEIDMGPALKLLAGVNAQGGAKITVTHLVAKALAVAIARFPEINARVRFWGKIEVRKTVDLFLQVASEGGRDLSGHRLANADKLPLIEFAASVKKAADAIRNDSDQKFKKSRGLISRLPWWFLRPFLALGSLFTNELNIDMSGSGMPKDPFGTAMVTSLGMWGVDEAYAPMLPIARCMMILLVPQVKDKVWVENGQMVIKPTLKLCATFDHRIVDGVHAAKLCGVLRELLDRPEQLVV